MPFVIKVVPPTAVKVMLAASEIPEEHQIRFPILASYKYDGIRGPIVSGTAMSRKMIALPNKFMQAWVRDNQAHLNGRDGEFIVGPPNLESTFNTSTSGIMSADGEPDFKFYVFDQWNLPARACVRQESLSSWYHSLPWEVMQRVVLVHQKLVNTLEELKAYYEEALELGYEGLILIDPNGSYKNGRSTITEGLSLKWKEFADINCRIVGVQQGKTNKNPLMKDALGKAKRSTAKAGKVLVETLGGFIVECIDPESRFFGKTFKAGTGCLTSGECDELWARRESLPGLILKVKFQKSGCKDKPRYPGFAAFRHKDDTVGV